MTYDKDRIAKRIKSLRIDAGYDQETLCQVSGVKISTLRSYEQGVSVLGLDNAVKLADALNCSIDTLVCRNGY